MITSTLFSQFLFVGYSTIQGMIDAYQDISFQIDYATSALFYHQSRPHET
jgi:hypothetical protein